MASSSRPSRSSVDIWTPERQQNYVDLLTLLQRGRNNGHIYRYREEIQDLYHQLDRYDPDRFEVLMTDPGQLDRTIASLEDLLERRAQHNPSISLSIKDLETFDTYKSFIVSLESFKMGHGNPSQIEKLSKHLGFSSEIADKLTTNPRFLDQTLTIMNGKIQQWLNTSAGKIVDLDPRYRRLFSYDNLIRSMYTGTFDLQTTALLSNPEGVKIAQFYTGCQVSGVKEEFFEDYSHKYYTRNCEKYDDPDICLIRGLKSGDEQLLDRVLAELTPDDYSSKIFDYLGASGRGDLVEKAINRHFEVFGPTLPDRQRVAIRTYQLYEHAITGAARKGHLELVKDYLTKLEITRDVMNDGPQADLSPYDLGQLKVNVIYYALQGGHADIVKYLYKIDPTITTNHFRKLTISSSAVAGGNFDLVKWMYENDHLHLGSALGRAIEECKVEIFDYLLSKMLDTNREVFEGSKDSYLGMAIYSNCILIARTLIKAGGRPYADYSKNKILSKMQYHWIWNTSIPMLKLLLDATETKDWPSREQAIDLIVSAISSNQMKTVKFLTDRWERKYRGIKSVIDDNLANDKYYF